MVTLRQKHRLTFANTRALIPASLSDCRLTFWLLFRVGHPVIQTCCPRCHQPLTPMLPPMAMPTVVLVATRMVEASLGGTRMVEASLAATRLVETNLVGTSMAHSRALNQQVMIGYHCLYPVKQFMCGTSVRGGVATQAAQPANCANIELHYRTRSLLLSLLLL